MRPRHDPSPTTPQGPKSSLLARLARAAIKRGRRGGRDTGEEPCPVEPNRPLDLSGGAAAALEFDD